MRKYFSLFVLLVVMLSLLAGCSAATAAVSEASQPENPDIRLEQAVYGKIKEINGNEVLLSIGTLEGGRPPNGGGEVTNGEPPALPEGEGPNRSEGEMPAFPEGTGPSQPEGEMPTLPEGERPSRPDYQEPPNQRPGQGDRAQRQQPSGDINVENGRAMPDSGQGNPRAPQRQQAITLTGEEKLYLIPETVEITSRRGTDETILEITQLAVDNTVCIYLNENEEVTAVQLLEQ